jgi:hypothetical protein
MKYGCLDARVKRTVLRVIDREEGLGIWREAGARILESRRAVYRQLRAKIRGPQAKPRPVPRQYRPEDPGFNAGDIISIPLARGERAFLKVIEVQRARKYDASITLMLLDHRVKRGEELPDWRHVPKAWFKVRETSGEFAGKIYGGRCISTLSWRGRGVPRKEIAVVGRAKVTAGERRAVRTGGRFQGFWNEVPQRIEESSKLGPPDREAGRGVAVPRADRARPCKD